MPLDIDRIKTIIVVMMENRSFDHMLGYLSLPPYNRLNVEGIKNDSLWRHKFANYYNGKKFHPYILKDAFELIDADPPHERDQIDLQMGKFEDGKFPMNGFVESYSTAEETLSLTPENLSTVMGYYTPEQVPITHFFAENFAICDHWFCSLPAGTQPNRLMSMSGFSNIDMNKFPLSNQDLVYDWLTERGIRWRVYHGVMPFFSMMPKWIPDIIRQDHFRPFREFYSDVQNEPPDEFPQVIFVDPAFTDAPHLGPSNDDHAPSAIKGGQEFLLEVYRCITSYPELWEGTVMIITYDEHGGFFDHVSPPLIRTEPPSGISFSRPFESLGVRVPAFVISPFVEPRTVYKDILDHTSILKFIGLKFGKNGRYSDIVSTRPVNNVFDVLNAPNSKRKPTIPSLEEYLKKVPMSGGFVEGSEPNTILQKGFQKALDDIRKDPARPIKTYGDLLDKFPHRPNI